MRSPIDWPHRLAWVARWLGPPIIVVNWLLVVIVEQMSGR
jgi:hypothetical protein